MIFDIQTNLFMISMHSQSWIICVGGIKWIAVCTDNNSSSISLFTHG
jgi:hypothetical protein